MPELPEVETTVRGIRPHLLKQTISQIILRRKTLRWPIPMQIKKNLINQQVLSVERRAKYILIATTYGTLIVHLGMSGRLRILTKKTAPAKHDHVDIIFANNKILRFTDPRRFGALLWTSENVSEHALIRHLGEEPLQENFNGNYLWQRAQKTKKAIKTLLMDHTMVTGIGNIYAAEALFAAGIHPAKPCNTLTLVQLDLLAAKIKIILQIAIDKGGTTLKDFSDSNGKPGYFSQQLKVYGRAGAQCFSCGQVLKNLQIGTRATVFCQNCQL